MFKIKFNDKVIVLCGKDKGKVGIVKKVFLDKKNNKRNLIIEGLNLFKKHTKSIPNKNKTGGILSKEMPIDYSNVALLCQLTGKGDKIFFKFLDNGKKTRFFKSNGEVVS